MKIIISRTLCSRTLFQLHAIYFPAEHATIWLAGCAGKACTTVPSSDMFDSCHLSLNLSLSLFHRFDSQHKVTATANTAELFIAGEIRSSEENTRIHYINELGPIDTIVSQLFDVTLCGS